MDGEAMCRYAMHDYPQHYACLECRLAFKGEWDRGEGYDGDRRCPHCAQPALAMGLDFKAPRKRNVGQWRKLALVVESGRRFASCGCNGPGRRPRTLADAKAEARDRTRSGPSRRRR